MHYFRLASFLLYPRNQINRLALQLFPEILEQDFKTELSPSRLIGQQ